MNDDYALDLRVARRRSGLTQEDCGHLLGVDPSHVTKFETGARRPSKPKLFMLCFLLDIPPELFVRKTVGGDLARLRERLKTMPQCPRHWRNWRKRLDTIRALETRLEGFNLDEL